MATPPHPLLDIVMRRPNLDGLPPVRVGPGYTLRAFRPGDEAAWAALFVAAFPEQPDPAGIHQREFLSKPLWTPEREFFACRDDVPVACTAAWEAPERFGPLAGQIHWVATRPDHLRRGLGRATALAALHYMKSRYDSAVLVTQTFRLPAIRLYLDLGFQPHMTALPEMPDRWATVEAALRG